MSRRAIALVVLAFLAGGALVWLGISIFGKDMKVAGPPLSTTTTLALSDTAHELLDRLNTGRAIELHATYTQMQDNGTTLTVDIWRKGDRVRQDLTLEGTDVKNQVEALQLPDGNVACQRSLTVDWVCQKAASVAQTGGAAGLFDAAASNLNGKQVTAKDEKIGNDDARCYTIVGTDATSEMCVTAEGIPVRLSSQNSALVLSSLERSVDDAVFTPPAPLTLATTTTTTSAN